MRVRMMLLVLACVMQGRVWAQDAGGAQPGRTRQVLDAAVGRTEPPAPVAADAKGEVAAARYFSLIERMPKPLASYAGLEKRSIASFELIDRADDMVTADGLKQMLKEAGPWIDELVAAAALERGELRMRGGWDDREWAEGDPRKNVFWSMRQSGRILRADAVRLWVEGDKRKAVERLGASLGMVRQFNQERYSDFMTLLSAAELEATTTLLVEMAAAQGAEALPGAEGLARTVAALDPKDPVGLRRGWVGRSAADLKAVEEGTKGNEVSTGLLVRIAELRASGVLFVAMMEAFGDKKVERKVQKVELSGVTADTLRERLEPQLEGVNLVDARAAALTAKELRAQIIEAWDRPEAEVWARATKAMEEDATSVIMLAIGSPKEIRRSWETSVKTLERLRKALRMPPERG